MNPDAYQDTLQTGEGSWRWGWGCRERLWGHTEVETQACLAGQGGEGHRLRVGASQTTAVFSVARGMDGKESCVPPATASAHHGRFPLCHAVEGPGHSGCSGGLSLSLS